MHDRLVAAPSLALLAALALPACGPAPAPQTPEQAARAQARRSALATCPSGRECVAQARALIRAEGWEGVEHGLSLLDAGCALDEAQACQMAGRWRLMARAIEPERDARARAAFTRACALGAPASCAALANMLRFGRGADADDARAAAALARGRALYPSPHPMLDTMHQDYTLAVVLPLIPARCPPHAPERVTLHLSAGGHARLSPAPERADAPAHHSAEASGAACPRALLLRALWLPTRATTTRELVLP